MTNNHKKFQDVIRLLSFFLVFSFQIQVEAEISWQEQNAGIKDSDLRSVSVFGADSNLICVAAEKSVYLSKDNGDSWEEIFSLGAKDAQLNFVAFDCFNSKIIFLASSDGLFTTEDLGLSWRVIFRRANEEANQVNWIGLDCLNSKTLYLGTDHGLYISQDKGASWQKSLGGLPPHSEAKAVLNHPLNSRVVYLANTYGLFKTTDAANTWRRTYISSHKISDTDNGSDEEGTNEFDEDNLINSIAIDKTNTKNIFFSTRNAVFGSSDAGDSWTQLSSEGLGSAKINFITTSSNKSGLIYAATKRGVFEFSLEAKKWRQLYQGMIGQNIRSLALANNRKQLFAATEKGFFKTVETRLLLEKQKEVEVASAEQTESELTDKLEQIYVGEPNIHQIHEAALRYAEVIHPKRIKALRRNAKFKALLPDVSVDYDKTIQAGGTGSNFGNFVIGPRDWGLSLSWDVGDLVFSEQVRLLDSNARLMVQLRDDIINEVTRFYFERRKLQSELVMLPPESMQDKINKLLRLEELTANIDGLTGGYFSRHIRTIIAR